MNEFYSPRLRPSSGARLLRGFALVLMILVAVGFAPFYLSAFQQRDVFGLVLPGSGLLSVLLLAFVHVGLLVALWRGYSLRRWGCVVLGAFAWLTTAHRG